MVVHEGDGRSRDVVLGHLTRDLGRHFAWRLFELPLTNVSIYANLTAMNYSITYFHPRVKAEIESWPDGILADYARIVELLMEIGPNLRMPHSHAMGGGLLELRPRGRDGIGRVFYCFVIGQRVIILHAFVKKTPVTPEPELKMARKRMKEVRNG